MKKIKHLYFILLFINFICWSQDTILPDSLSIMNRFNSLDQAFIGKDTAMLDKLLHKNLTLGHSNGWVETKMNALETLMKNGVIYHSIQIIGIPKIEYYSENIITTRRNINVIGILKDKTFNVFLNVLEIWTCETGNWQLLARQSVKSN